MDKIRATGICFIVEPGYLEEQAKLLVDSLRTFGGLDLEVPLYAFQPRMSGQISKNTLSFFQANNVRFKKLALNTKSFFLPVANKIYALAYFEENCEDHIEKILFLDTDIMVIKPISILLEIKSPKIFMSPIYLSKGNAVSYNGTPNLFWKIILDNLKINISDFWPITTVVDKKVIYHHYNSGVIMAPKSINLFSQACKYFESTLKDKRIVRIDDRTLFFIEQAIISSVLTLLAGKDSVQTLDIKYNYPLELMNDNLDDAHIIHYQEYFYNTPSEDWNLPLPMIEKVKNYISMPKIPKSKFLKLKEVLSSQRFKLKMAYL